MLFTTEYSRGDVVLVSFMFSEETGGPNGALPLFFARKRTKEGAMTSSGYYK